MLIDSYQKYIQELEQQRENNDKQIQNKIAQKKFYKKGLLARFKTMINSERMEEKIKYKIEYEKYKKKNRAICFALHHLDKKEEELTSLSKKYNMFPKATVSDKNEQQQKVKELTTMLEKALQELDILVTKQVLHDETWMVRNTNGFIMKTCIYFIIGALLSTIIIGTPISIILNSLAISLEEASSIMIVILPLIGGFGTFAYMTKIMTNTMKAFHNLNRNLNEAALPEKIKNYNDATIINNSFKIDKKRMEIINLHLQIAEEKSVLETLETSENQTTQTSNLHQAFTYDIEEEPLEKGKTFILKRNTVNH